MKIITNYILLIAFTFIATSNNSFAIEKEIYVKGTRQANLKTYNGCWDVNHFIFCKGDSSIQQHPSFGYIDYNQFPPLYVHIDSIPNFLLQDFAIYSLSQFDGWNPLNRYFTLITIDKTYLYATQPPLSQLPPTTLRIDSLNTPLDFVFSKMLNDTMLLIANRMADSIHYAYTYYTLPSFAIDTQLIFLLKPEEMYVENSISNKMIIKGDSVGTNRMIKINFINYITDFDLTLPTTCSNTKKVGETVSEYYLFSSPGDSTIILTSINKNSFAIADYFLNNDFGISISDYKTNFSDIIYQTSKDTSANQLDKKLLVLHLNLIPQVDTFNLGVSMNSFHYNNTLGFGPSFYHSIFSPIDSFKNKVMIADFFYNVTDTITTPQNPTWYAEDSRCYGGINEINKHLTIHVYPNPASDEIAIAINGMQKGVDYNFEMINETGSILFTQTMKAKEEYIIPINEMPSGILFLRVTGNGTNVTKKIIKL